MRLMHLCRKVLRRCLFVTGLCVSMAAGGHVQCSIGDNVADGYPANYTVMNRHVSASVGCQRVSDVGSESHLPPGSPRIFGAEAKGSELIFTWGSPDDGSVQFLKGFLLEIYVDTDTEELVVGPNACYTVTLADMGDKVRLQDSVFRLSCNLSRVHPCTPVHIYVTSFPLPQRLSVKFRTINVTTNPGECSRSSGFVQSMGHKSDESSSSPPTTGKNNLIPAATMSGGTVLVISATAFAIIKHRRKKRQDSSSKENKNNVKYSASSEAESKVLDEQTELQQTPETPLAGWRNGSLANRHGPRCPKHHSACSHYPEGCSEHWRDHNHPFCFICDVCCVRTRSDTNIYKDIKVVFEHCQTEKSAIRLTQEVPGSTVISSGMQSVKLPNRDHTGEATGQELHGSPKTTLPNVFKKFAFDTNQDL